MSPEAIATIIASLGFGAVVQAVIGYFKDRKKISAEVKITDIEGLQGKLKYLEQVIEVLDKYNGRLREELDETQVRERGRVSRIRELEDELERVRVQVLDTKRRCDMLTEQLAALARKDPKGETA